MAVKNYSLAATTAGAMGFTPKKTTIPTAAAGVSGAKLAANANSGSSGGYSGGGASGASGGAVSGSSYGGSSGISDYQSQLAALYAQQQSQAAELAAQQRAAAESACRSGMERLGQAWNAKTGALKANLNFTLRLATVV